MLTELAAILPQGTSVGEEISDGAWNGKAWELQRVNHSYENEKKYDSIFLLLKRNEPVIYLGKLE